MNSTKNHRALSNYSRWKRHPARSTNSTTRGLIRSMRSRTRCPGTVCSRGVSVSSTIGVGLLPVADPRRRSPERLLRQASRLQTRWAPRPRRAPRHSIRVDDRAGACRHAEAPLTTVLQECRYPTPMEKETQISALVSRTTKELLDRHVRATGVKKSHLVEQALRHHLQALQELPADVIIHPKVVVTRKSGEGIVKEMETGNPTEALRHLMRDGD